MSRRGDIFARVEHDIQRGDLALARTRLESYLDHNGYDPDLLARLGRIAADMHDPATAGRFWLTSNLTGEEAENAIRHFIHRCGEDPFEIAFRLPRVARLSKIDEYPSLVRERLEKHGLIEKVIWAGRQREGLKNTAPWTLGAIIMAVIAIVALLVGSAVFVVGLYTIGKWLS